MSKHAEDQNDPAEAAAQPGESAQRAAFADNSEGASGNAGVSGLPEWMVKLFDGWPAVGLIFAVALVAYLPALGGTPIWDDNTFVFDSPLVTKSSSPAPFWLTRQATDFFPLTYTAFWVQWRVFGSFWPAYHLVNILVHAAGCVLLWRILRRLAVPGALVGALVLAVHPVLVEGVAWIFQLKGTLAVTLLLLSWYLYLRSETDEGGRTAWYIESIIVFALALLAKTSVVAAPLVLLLYAWWRRGRIAGRDVLRSVPFFALSVAIGLVAMSFQKESIGTEIVRAGGPAARVAEGAWALLFYMAKTVIPLRLSMVYPSPNLDPSSIMSYLPLLGVAGLALLVWQGGRGARFAFLGYLAMLLPALGVVDIFFMRFAIVADHWQQPALVLLVPAIVAGLAWATRRLALQWRTGIAAVVIGVLAVLSMVRAGNFTSEKAAWRDTVAKNAGAWLAHNQLGVILMDEAAKPEPGPAEREALYVEAIDHLTASVSYNPVFFDAYTNLGNAWLFRSELRFGNEAMMLAKAIDSYHRAIQITQTRPGRYPEVYKAYQNLGIALGRTSQYEDAAAALESALAAAPADISSVAAAGIQVAIADIHEARGQFRDAVRAYARAIRHDPENPVWRLRYALVAMRLGDQNADERARRYAEAITQLGQAIRYGGAMPPEFSDSVRRTIARAQAATRPSTTTAPVTRP